LKSNDSQLSLDAVAIAILVDDGVPSSGCLVSNAKAKETHDMRGRKEATFGSKAFGKSVSRGKELEEVFTLCLCRLLPVGVAILPTLTTYEQHASMI